MTDTSYLYEYFVANSADENKDNDTEDVEDKSNETD